MRIVHTAGDFALTANYRIDDFVATVNWAEEIAGTIFALHDSDSDGVLNAYDVTPLGEDRVNLFAGGNGFADARLRALSRFTMFGNCKRSMRVAVRR